MRWGFVREIAERFRGETVLPAARAVKGAEASAVNVVAESVRRLVPAPRGRFARSNNSGVAGSPTAADPPAVPVSGGRARPPGDCPSHS
ncbi:hypothetical protein GCM10010269_37700 [Streptomyces humidus]|uniref:Uncharacterized protein n=1 Tax=Streptomyces humidus TaxID=52259 RepID=A0A918FXD8_9ACTN|nr:hypothetical protein GCM10010269_37700 [Streptomyces humidus]